MKEAKLTLEEQEDLFQFMASDAWPALLKVLQTFEKRHINKVLKYHLNSGADGLLIEKARVEGVSALVQNITEYRNKIIREG